MSPGTPSTPPRTPSRSPKGGEGKGQTPKQTLEVGQNGFYFSIEIPEKKITPRRAAAPDVKASGRLTPGRLTPSPQKDKRGEVKGGGRVKDILRKNLFGTPTKRGTKFGRNDQDTRELEKDREVKMSPSKNVGVQLRTSDGSESESAQEDALKEAATERTIAPFALQKPSTSLNSLAKPASTVAPSRIQQSAMPPDQQQTPQALPSAPALTTDTAPVFNLQNSSAASTPSNIGHLIANLSNKSSKVQVLPTTSGLESMPTPLRKMSERLGPRSPHVVRKDKIDGNGQITPAAMSKKETLRSPISVLDLKGAATVENRPAAHIPAGAVATTTSLAASQREYAMHKEDRLAQLIPYPITTALPIDLSRPSTATTPYFASPSTPCRPGLPSRSKSFGTPARLRSSIQEDMFKVQETLKRSLGQDAFHKNGTRPTTPVSPIVASERPSTSATNRSRSTVQKSTRPVSTVGPAESNGPNTTQAVPQRRLNTAAHKPRPKSMITGSAKILETVAAQIDSPHERAKLRSAAATPTSARSRPTISRPGTAASMSRESKLADNIGVVEKPQPTVRMTKSAALRAAAHTKPTALSAPKPTSRPQKQRVASAEAIAHRAAHRKDEDRKKAGRKLPMCTKSMKASSKPAVKPTSNPPADCRPKTPEPKDTKADSGTAQSYTPPGHPTRLPSPTKSPSKTRLFSHNTPAPASAMNPQPKMETRKRFLPPAAPQLNTPFPIKTTLDRNTDVQDSNVLRSPSKEIQSSLDAAIDRKIAEDRRRAGWL